MLRPELVVACEVLLSKFQLPSLFLPFWNFQGTFHERVNSWRTSNDASGSIIHHAGTQRAADIKP